MGKEVCVDGGHGSMTRRDCRAFDCTFLDEDTQKRFNMRAFA
jgi:hypothetical protein